MEKEELGSYQFFFTPTDTSGKAREDFLPLSKKGVARHYNYSRGVLAGGGDDSLDRPPRISPRRLSCHMYKDEKSIQIDVVQVKKKQKK